MLLTCALESAFAHRKESCNGKSLRSAAIGFIGLLEDFVFHTTGKFDLAGFATEHFAGYEQIWKEDLDSRRKHNKAFVSRLKARQEVAATEAAQGDAA